MPQIRQQPAQFGQHLAAGAQHRAARRVPVLAAEAELEALEPRHRILVEELEEAGDDVEHLSEVEVVDERVDGEALHVAADARQTRLDLVVAEAVLVRATVGHEPACGEGESADVERAPEASGQEDVVPPTADERAGETMTQTEATEDVLEEDDRKLAPAHDDGCRRAADDVIDLRESDAQSHSRCCHLDTDAYTKQKSPNLY